MSGTPMLDVFPALVESPEGAFQTVRALVAEDWLLLFQSGPQGVELLRALRFVDWNISEVRGLGPWLFTLEDGTTWRVIQSRGCGCGNPLKRASVRGLLDLAGVPA